MIDEEMAFSHWIDEEWSIFRFFSTLEMKPNKKVFQELKEKFSCIFEGHLKINAFFLSL
jgi:hypothetical protein